MDRRSRGDLAAAGLALLVFAPIVLDLLGVWAMPRLLPVVLMPVIGAAIWRLGGAPVLAIASWVIPLAALLFLGYGVADVPLDAILIAGGYLWFVAMILTERVPAAWYRALGLGSRSS